MLTRKRQIKEVRRTRPYTGNVYDIFSADRLDLYLPAWTGGEPKPHDRYERDAFDRSYASVTHRRRGTISAMIALGRNDRKPTREGLCDSIYLIHRRHDRKVLLTDDGRKRTDE